MNGTCPGSTLKSGHKFAGGNICKILILDNVGQNDQKAANPFNVVQNKIKTLQI